MFLKNNFSYKDSRNGEECEFKIRKSKYKVYYKSNELSIYTSVHREYSERIKIIEDAYKFIEFFFYNSEFQEEMIKNKLIRPEVKQ